MFETLAGNHHIITAAGLIDILPRADSFNAIAGFQIDTQIVTLGEETADRTGGITTTYCNITLASTTIVGYDFEDLSGAFENAPEISISTVEPTPWFDLRGSLTDFTGNPGRALAARTFLDGNTMMLVLNVLPGFSAQLDGYSFDHLASASGPMNWELEINTTPIASGATSTSFTNVSGALSLTDITDSITVELFGSAASSNSGTYRLDNFVLSGTVTPVPLAPSILLFGSALAFVSTRLKR